MPPKYFKSLTFRQTAVYVCLLVIAEIVVFGFLYWSTVGLYLKHVDNDIHKDVEVLRTQLGNLEITEMAAVITKRTTDNPGEFDLYILATARYEHIAGNVPKWPQGIEDESAVLELDMWEDDGTAEAYHRVRTATLPRGHHLLVGRNLGEFRHVRNVIGRSLLRTVVLTLLIGLGGGIAFSKVLASRLDKINQSAFAILRGDISSRVPIEGTGDEIDQLSENLNHMLDRIEALMRGMREVTDNVAHDIRKPISRLRSRIEVVLMQSRDAEAYRVALEQTLHEADDILVLFNSLLTIAEAESGALRDRFETVDLADVVRSAVEFYEPLALEQGRTLSLHTEEAIAVHGERHLIAQAVGNLLDNAIKHAPGSGEVSVRASRDGAEARIIVADQGPGIPEAARKKVVERFARLEESRTTPGSGLGLSLVRAVADLHGGRLSLDDNRPGLRATLTIPV